MDVRHPMVRYPFIFYQKIFFDKMDLRLFYFCVPIYLYRKKKTFSVSERWGKKYYSLINKDYDFFGLIPKIPFGSFFLLYIEEPDKSQT